MSNEVILIKINRKDLEKFTEALSQIDDLMYQDELNDYNMVTSPSTKRIHSFNHFRDMRDLLNKFNAILEIKNRNFNPWGLENDYVVTKCSTGRYHIQHKKSDSSICGRYVSEIVMNSTSPNCRVCIDNYNSMGLLIDII